MMIFNLLGYLLLTVAIFSILLYVSATFRCFFFKKMAKDSFEQSFGLRFLLYWTFFRDLIFLSKTLSAVINVGQYAGTTVLHWLIQSPMGNTFLSSNPMLFTKMTDDDLFAETGAGYASTNLYVLMSQEKGIALLTDHACVRQHVATLLKESHTSRVSDVVKTSLCALIHAPGGLALLQTCDGGSSMWNPKSYLRDILEANLNDTITRGPWKERSVLYALASSPEGRGFLSGNDLIKCVTERGLQAVIPSGPDAGNSVLTVLACLEEGRLMLRSCNSWFDKINADGLATVISSGPDAGKNVLAVLLCAEEQRRWDLRDKIFELSNQVIQKALNDALPVLLEGQNTIIIPEDFFSRHDLIDAERMRKWMSESTERSVSILIKLLKKNSSCAWLLKHKALVAILTDHLFLNTEQSSEASVQVSSLLQALTSTMKGCHWLWQQERCHALPVTVIETLMQSSPPAALTVLYIMLMTKQGSTLLKENSDFSAMVAMHLSTIIESGACRGLTLLHALVNTKNGLSLFIDKQNLCSQITEKALDSILFRGYRYDEEALGSGFFRWNRSDSSHDEQWIPVGNALFGLLNQREGRQWVFDNPGLRHKVSQKALNDVVPYGAHQGKTALYLLSQSPRGLELLQCEMVEKIDERGLNAIVSGVKDVYRGESVLYRLASDKKGRLFLGGNEKIRNLITQEGLNYVIPNEAPIAQINWLRSSLWWLTSSIDSCAWFLQDAALVAKMDDLALNTIVFQQKSPLWQMFHNQLQASVSLFCKNEDFRSKITEVGLNTSDDEHKKSVLYMLSCTENAQKIFCEDPYIREKITKEGLNTPILSSDRGATTLFRLISTPYGRTILFKEPRIREMIDVTGLNTPIATGQNKGMTALFSLVLCITQLRSESHSQILFLNDISTDGLTFFLEEICQNKVTPVGLNTPVSTGSQAGMTVLYLLTRFDLLFLEKLLSDQSFISKVTAEGLNARIQCLNVDSSGHPLPHLNHDFGVSVAQLWVECFKPDQCPLLRHKVLQDMISEETLNTPILFRMQHGDRPSLLAKLLDDNERYKIFAQNDTLRAKINLDGLLLPLSIDGTFRVLLERFLEREELRTKVANDAVFTRTLAPLKEAVSAPSKIRHQAVSALMVYWPGFFNVSTQKNCTLRERFETMLEEDVRNEEIRYWAKSVHGRLFLATATQFYPKKYSGELLSEMPDFLHHYLFEVKEQSYPLEKDPITLEVIGQPVQIKKPEQDNPEPGIFDYRFLYWVLLSTGKNPMTNTEILRLGEDPDDFILCDDMPSRTRKVLSEIEARLSKLLLQQVTDSALKKLLPGIDNQTYLLTLLNDPKGLDFLMCFPKILQSLSQNDFSVEVQSLPGSFLALYCCNLEQLQSTRDLTLLEVLRCHPRGQAFLAMLSVDKKCQPIRPPRGTSNDVVNAQSETSGFQLSANTFFGSSSSSHCPSNGV